MFKVFSSAVLAAFLLWGCDGGSSETPEANLTPSANPGTYSAVPITQAQIDTALARLDAIAQNALDVSGVPGMAIAVVHNDKTVYAKGFGVRYVGSTEPVDGETVFQLASLSKSVSATIVAGAVGDGTVEWNSSVADYLPSFALSDDYATHHVTIADLFAHRSGLPDHAGDLFENIGYDQDYIFSHLHCFPLTPLRTTYAYTNAGLSAGAEAAARAANTTWDALAKQRLYDRLGMTMTSSRFDDFMARQNKALGNVKRDGIWVRTPLQRDPDPQSPAGGVSSNVVDMAKWMRLVLNGGMFDGEEIVKPAPLIEALSPHMLGIPLSSLDARPSLYGLGFGSSTDAVGRTRISHSGAFLLGSGTNYTLLPSADLGIIVLTNGEPHGIAEAVAASFLDIVETGGITFDWLSLFPARFASMYVNHSILADKTPPDPADPARPYAAYVGTYANDCFGPVEIALAGDNLLLRVGPKPQEFILSHFDGDVFSYYPTGEDAVGISAVTFSGGDATAAAAVTIEFLNEHGLGTFIR